MKPPSDRPDPEELRRKILGLGPGSMRKSFYPELQKRLQELENSEKRFRSIVEAAPYGILFFRRLEDQRWVFDGGNPAAERILGFSSQEKSGAAVEDLPFDEILKNRIRQVFLHGEDGLTSHAKPILCRTPSGEVALEMVAFSIQPGALVFHLTDVTRRTLLEQQLAEAQRLEVVGRLAGGIAHDFNNLLTPILGYLQMIIEETPETDRWYESLIEIQKAADSARNISKSLLAISRRQILNIVAVDLVQILRDFAKILRRTIRENVEMVFDLWHEPLIIKTDPTQIQQILLNLALNAQDAMPDGGKLRIRVFRQVGPPDGVLPSLLPTMENCVVMHVTDTGSGIPAENLGHIFEPFYSTKGNRGSGLGLATVYGIVQQFNGQIRVKSKPDQGTEFAIAFPLAPAAAAISRGENRRPGRLRDRAQGGGRSVFLVEDNQQVRELITTVLQDAGYEVHPFSSAEDCLRWVPPEAMSPCVLVSDVILPGRNGCELFKELKKRWGHLRVLFVSGYPGEVLQQQGLSVEAAVLTKPFSNDLLLQKVAELLDRES